MAKIDTLATAAQASILDALIQHREQGKPKVGTLWKLLLESWIQPVEEGSNLWMLTFAWVAARDRIEQLEPEPARDLPEADEVLKAIRQHFPAPDWILAAETSTEWVTSRRLDAPAFRVGGSSVTALEIDKVSMGRPSIYHSAAESPCFLPRTGKAPRLDLA